MIDTGMWLPPKKDKATQDSCGDLYANRWKKRQTAASIVDMIKKAGATGIFFVDVKLGER